MDIKPIQLTKKIDRFKNLPIFCYYISFELIAQQQYIAKALKIASPAIITNTMFFTIKMPPTVL